MSEHHLPDDVRRWPPDPYALLGVTPAVSARDLKKAYARLIRQYRPEEFPEQFRRVRDAFEAVQQNIKYSSWFAPPPEEPVESRGDSFTDPPSPEDAYEDEMDGAGTPATLRYDSSPYDPGPTKAPRQDETIELWEKACAGEEELAYRRLRDLYRENPSDKDILLRLYWLLNLSPSLDPVRHPCDWLAESLRSSALSGSGRELYRRYLVNHPEEAMSERYSNLIQCPTAAANLAQMLEWRWQAVGRLHDCAALADVIADDLEKFGQNLARDDEENWGRLLFFATDQLAWFTEEPVRRVFQHCCEEIDKLEHLQSRLGESFARLDYLKDLSEAWKSSRWIGGEANEAWDALIRLIPATWTRSPAELRFIFLQYFEEAWDNPHDTLKLLDEVKDRAPILLSQLGQTLESLLFSVPSRFGEEIAQDEIETRTRRFLRGIDGGDYAQFRWKLVNFCFREFLAPERIAEVMESRDRDPAVIQLFTWVRNDWPVRCLCQAHRLFWA